MSVARVGETDPRARTFHRRMDARTARGFGAEVVETDPDGKRFGGARTSGTVEGDAAAQIAGARRDTTSTRLAPARRAGALGERTRGASAACVDAIGAGSEK